VVFDHRDFLPGHLQDGQGPIDRLAQRYHLQAFGEAWATLGAAFCHANGPVLDMPMAVTAKPKVVVAGLDLGALGEVRKIETIPVLDNLQKGRIVAVGSLAFSPVGSALVLETIDLAQSLATALSAVKLIYFLPEESMPKAPLSTLTVKEARSLSVQCTPFCQRYLEAAIRAIESGVRRVHILDEDDDGALLTELFTHAGSGVMVTENPLGMVRPAQADDLAAIAALIEPLAKEGLLLARDKSRLETELSHLYVLDNEGMIMGCAALNPFL
jgi:amino-acid N-acetyltransferase